MYENFELDTLIAEGGHGQVYKGTDKTTGRPVVIKRLKPHLYDNPQLVARFLLESEALKKLNHPNIIKFIASFDHEERHHIVLEYVQSGSLRDLLSRKGSLPQERCLEIAIELNDALIRAHHIGIWHRDIKPSNVLLTENGTPLLTDFGIARLLESNNRLTPTQGLIGSPKYLSPEIINGKAIDGRTDIWAFGILLYEMLMGNVPFKGGSLPALLMAIVNQPLPNEFLHNSEIHPQLITLIRAMLERDPNNRIATMRQVSVQLEAIQIGQEVPIPIIERELTPIDAYHQQMVTTLSNDQYQIDKQFINLSLLIDQGSDAIGARFVRDSAKPQYDNLVDVLDNIEETVSVVLGGPGSGKTTLLRKLQYDLAQEELTSRSGYLCFFANLNNYNNQYSSNLNLSPEEWLLNEWSKRYPDLPPFNTFWQSGWVYLLLDGLNEIPHRNKKEYREIIKEWREFLITSKNLGNKIIFSCRSLDYSAPLSSAEVQVRQIRIESLSSEHIKTFISLNIDSEEFAKQVWQEIKSQPQQLALFSNPFFLKLFVNQIKKNNVLHIGQAALLTGFVRQALHREVVEIPHYLFEPDELLSEGDYEQVLHNVWQTAYDLPWENFLFEVLEKLAFDMQKGRHGSEGGQVRIPERDAIEWIGHPRARDLIQAGIQLNILNKEISTRELTFSHQLIQEFFAARQLIRELDFNVTYVPWQASEMVPSLEEIREELSVSEPLPPAPTTGWEETTILASAMSSDSEKFIRDLIPFNLQLAARCAASSDVNISNELLEEIQNKLIKRTQTKDADLRARIAAGNALGQLGDPRFIKREGPYGSYLYPPLCLISGNVYQIGSENHADIDEPDVLEFVYAEQPVHSIKIPSFEIGSFPVTNAEFKLFIESGGYETENWWKFDEARQWLNDGAEEELLYAAMQRHAYWRTFTKEEITSIPNLHPAEVQLYLELNSTSEEDYKKQALQQLEEARSVEDRSKRTFEYLKEYNPITDSKYSDQGLFNQPNQPVIGINFYEALAYCNWLSAQTEQQFDLPTEVEWEAAASGISARRFAFGDHFNMDACNTQEGGIHGTTPIGIFPLGRTLEGVYDLTGGIAELTRSKWGPEIMNNLYRYPYDPNDGREEYGGLAYRIIKGGNWFSSRHYARNAWRDFFLSAEADFTGGFRLVRRINSV